MPRQYQILFNLIALFIIVFLGVDTAYRILLVRMGPAVSRQVVMPVVADQKMQQSQPLTAYEAIGRRNIFGAVVEPVAEKVEVEKIEVLAPTSLKLVLLGTIAGDEESARAIIQDERERSQNIYRQGDTIQGAVIQMILRGKVVLRVGEKDEVLMMAEQAQKSVSSAQAKGDESAGEGPSKAIVIKREEIDESLQNINEMMTQVRIRPYFKAGKADGLIVSQIKGGSIFAKLGLNNGDIIKTVNGAPIKSPEDAVSLYQTLKGGTGLEMNISRKGRPRTLNYEIK